MKFFEKILDRYFALKGIKLVQYEAMLCGYRTRIVKTKTSYRLEAKKMKYDDKYFLPVKEVSFNDSFEQFMNIYHNGSLWRDFIVKIMEGSDNNGN